MEVDDSFTVILWMVDEGGGAWISQIILYIEDRALLFLSKKTIKSLIETPIWFTWLGCVLVRLRLVDCALMISWFATDSRQNANLPSLLRLERYSGICDHDLMKYFLNKNIWKILHIFPQLLTRPVFQIPNKDIISTFPMHIKNSSHRIRLLRRCPWKS